MACKSIRQSIIALSSAEDEYIALPITAKELTWLRRLCWEIKYQRPYVSEAVIPPIIVFSEKTADLAIYNKQGLNARTKHIEEKFHHIRHLRWNRKIRLEYIPKFDQVAEILTKPVD